MSAARVRRRRAVRGLSVAWLLVLAVLLYRDARMRRSGGAGLLSFEFAGSRSATADMLRRWDAGAERAARWAQVVDVALVAIYAPYLTIAVASTRDKARRLGRAGLVRVARLARGAVIVAAVADLVQNAALLLAGTHRSSVRTSRWCAA